MTQDFDSEPYDREHCSPRELAGFALSGARGEEGDTGVAEHLRICAACNTRLNSVLAAKEWIDLAVEPIASLAVVPTFDSGTAAVNIPSAAANAELSTADSLPFAAELLALLRRAIHAADPSRLIEQVVNAPSVMDLSRRLTLREPTGAGGEQPPHDVAVAPFSNYSALAFADDAIGPPVVTQKSVNGQFTVTLLSKPGQDDQLTVIVKCSAAGSSGPASVNVGIVGELATLVFPIALDTHEGNPLSGSRDLGSKAALTRLLGQQLAFVAVLVGE